MPAHRLIPLHLLVTFASTSCSVDLVDLEAAPAEIPSHMLNPPALSARQGGATATSSAPAVFMTYHSGYSSGSPHYSTARQFPNICWEGYDQGFKQSLRSIQLPLFSLTGWNIYDDQFSTGSPYAKPLYPPTSRFHGDPRHGYGIDLSRPELADSTHWLVPLAETFRSPTETMYPHPCQWPAVWGKSQDGKLLLVNPMGWWLHADNLNMDPDWIGAPLDNPDDPSSPIRRPLGELEPKWPDRPVL